MKRKYDDVVIGSGPAGLTAAVLLAASGRRVGIVEKAPKIGGSLPRFYYQGIPFDTGFHFTGGLGVDGLADDIFAVIGIRDDLVVLPLRDARANRFIFESEGIEYEFPPGIEPLIARLKADFPGERAAIERYMQMTENVCRMTGGMRIDAVARPSGMLDEDFVTLSTVLDGLTQNQHLKALLSGYCMCYGSKPSEISFANHARVCWSIYQSLSRVERGGDALVSAFRRRLRELGVEVLTRRWVVECADVSRRHVGRLVLNDGDEIEFGNCIWAIHPKSMVAVLPDGAVAPAFRNRIAAFESSTGFFATYGVLDELGRDTSDDDYSIVSLFPSTNVDALLEHDPGRESAIVVLTSPGERPHASVKPVCTLEPACMDEVAAWTGSTQHDRPPEYDAYKAARVERTRARLARSLPDFDHKLRMMRSATALTYQHYLNSPDGAAYGVRQKMGQINVFGRLPVRNMYATGQSALLPGVLGAMMSSFMVVRQMLGKDAMDELLVRKVRT